MVKSNLVISLVPYKSTRASSLSILDPISQSVGKNVDSAFFCQIKSIFFITQKDSSIPPAIDYTNILFDPTNILFDPIIKSALVRQK